ncbi:GNAT family N-acetyltransferase [Rhodoferax sp.]|uniref:GNAT family N-acetyltransferase n=1 Tax=Rhodoferax sp. TaxID=50421 RepID=UPI0025E9F2D4|nr:GNAT family N-acetyltransferase [Rhodoferax sp.]
MKHSRASNTRKFVRHGLRKAFAFLPRPLRFSIYRSFVDCDPNPDARLVLKIADTQEELEACFKLLHDAYVGSGFMQPDPSGLRATVYHALPTTTTLCAKFDGEVVGTISLIRQSSFGFPLQAIFDLSEIHAEKGKIAEISALAVHPRFRKSGGSILFPLMKFMYQYSTTFFDTYHLVIAVNPDRIEMYESLLFFKRLQKHAVQNYDFANGAPAIGATLNLLQAPKLFKKIYGGKPKRKNLYFYFVKTKLKNIILPTRRYFTTNDPVMTPAMLDYFFNQRTQVFAHLSNREKLLLAAIYDMPHYQAVLPSVVGFSDSQQDIRQHQRYSLKCRGVLTVDDQAMALQLVELSDDGFQAHAKGEVPLNVWASVQIQLGSDEVSTMQVMAVRGEAHGEYHYYGFKLAEPDLAWRKFVTALQLGITAKDLDNATLFLPGHQDFDATTVPDLLERSEFEDTRPGR